MELVEYGLGRSADYRKFVKQVYRDVPGFKNNTDWTTKLILSGKSHFGRNAEIIPVSVCDDEGIAAVCTYIRHCNLPDYLQIAFFEALPGKQSAVDMIVDKARVLCREHAIPKICVGLNGHVNYGFGMLADNFSSPIAFGDWYNPDYYPDYFAGHADRTYYLSSFRGEIAKIDYAFLEKATARFCRGFTFRKADFRNFRREMSMYTDLNNGCFGEHPFYYRRTYEEDYELFGSLRLLMREEDLIFAEADGKPAGFLLGYPDFNALVPDGGTAGLGTFVKNRLLPGAIDRFKIVEMGVLPEYKQSGLILGLFQQCYKFAGNRYRQMVSSWIWDENHESRACARRLMDEEYKHFKVFEIDA